MKNIIEEVIFPAFGDWSVVVYGWSKELARKSSVPFTVLHDESTDDSHSFARKLLAADGYFYSHYQQLPPAHSIILTKSINDELINYLSECSGLMVVRLKNTIRGNNQYDNLKPKHLIFSVPKLIVKEDGVPEFTNLLRQASIINIPFNFTTTFEAPWHLRLRQNLDNLFRAGKNLVH